jgi:hypothetical protein
MKEVKGTKKPGQKPCSISGPRSFDVVMRPSEIFLFRKKSWNVESLKFTSGYMENLGRISKYVISERGRNRSWFSRGRKAIPTPIETQANGGTCENNPLLDIDYSRPYTFFVREGDMIAELTGESGCLAEKRISRTDNRRTLWKKCRGWAV